jgi:alcohol dehydrogenase (cytochrome c)
MLDAHYRPGDNLYTNSLISWDADTGKMNWYFQYVPGDIWNFDEAGTHILVDGKVAGLQRKLITHAARNGFLYTFERVNGRALMAKPYVDAINWTKGIDQKTGKPLDYDPGKDIQTYSAQQNKIFSDSAGRLCPSITGGNNFWPASYSRRTELLYVMSMSSCNGVTLDANLSNQAGDWKGAAFRDIGRNESDLVVIDPFTGEVKRKLHSSYPNNSGVLSTAGGLIFTGYTDGTFAAYDDATLDELWKINVGTGFAAPPMTFEVVGKQYVAILSGLSRASRNRNSVSPELRDMRNQTMLFVFGL